MRTTSRGAVNIRIDFRNVCAHPVLYSRLHPQRARPFAYLRRRFCPCSLDCASLATSQSLLRLQKAKFRPALSFVFHDYLWDKVSPRVSREAAK